jgi:hypothetical protein
MFIESVPNRIAPPAVLLRESYRDETGRTQKRTLANLSKLPDVVVAALRAILKGGTLIGTGPDELQIERSLPYGHVAAALGTICKIALDRLILSTAKDAKARHCCDLVVDAERPADRTPLQARAGPTRRRQRRAWARSWALAR